MRSFKQLTEKKDHLVKRLKNLSQEEKDMIIRTFKRKPHLEDKIDWNNKNLTMQDFIPVLASTSKREKKKAVRDKGIRGLKKNEDYISIPMKNKNYIAYVPLHLEASKLIASTKIGPCEGKWCIAANKGEFQWKNYVMQQGKTPVFLISNTHKFAVMVYRGESKVDIYDSSDNIIEDIPDIDIMKDLVRPNKKLFADIRINKFEYDFVQDATVNNADYWMEGADVEWRDGDWIQGRFISGKWNDGTWIDGEWMNGDWFDGIWKDGVWNNGDHYGGIWLKGTWLDGEWHGGDWHGGRWKGGTWNDGTWIFGQWDDGVWMGGQWRGGDFVKGDWYHGDWMRGTWWSGNFMNGSWSDGEWYGGKWYKGDWHKGKWHNGDWYNGIWHNGQWYKGTFHDGLWKNGVWGGGDWKGGTWLDGTWMGGTWHKGVWGGGGWYGGKWIRGYDGAGNLHGEDDSPDKWKDKTEMRKM